MTVPVITDAKEYLERMVLSTQNWGTEPKSIDGYMVGNAFRGDRKIAEYAIPYKALAEAADQFLQQMEPLDSAGRKHVLCGIFTRNGNPEKALDYDRWSEPDRYEMERVRHLRDTAREHAAPASAMG